MGQAVHLSLISTTPSMRLITLLPANPGYRAVFVQSRLISTGGVDTAFNQKSSSS